MTFKIKFSDFNEYENWIQDWYMFAGLSIYSPDGKAKELATNFHRNFQIT